MNKEFKAHPLMVLKLLKPFLFILVFPVLKGIVQYLLYRKVSGILTLEIVAFIAILTIAALRCYYFRLKIKKNNIEIKSGFLFVRRSIINISKLSSVKTEQNPFDTLFNAVTYSINTEAGEKGKADFEFKLSLRDSNQISELLYGNENRAAIKFSFFKLAAMAATTSSAVTGLIISVPIINKTGKLLGLALSDLLVDEINNVSGSVKTYFPPIVNAITLTFFLAYFVAFLYSLLKYMNFKLYLGSEKLEIDSGLIVRRRNAFKKSSIKNVKIEQTPLMRLVHRYGMKVSVGGYGDSNSESAVIVPCARHGEIKRQFSLYFPFLVPDGKIIHAKRSRASEMRFLYMPITYCVIIIAVSVILVSIFSYFDRLILFLTAVSLGVVCYYADLCIYNYNFGKVRFGENIYAQSSKAFKSCELYCAKENIGEIRIIRYPADFVLNTCRIVIIVRSESADSIRVRHLDYKKVKQEINNCFNLDI